ESSIKNERFVLVAENIDFKRLLQNIAKVLKKPVPSKSLKPWMLTFGWAVQTMGSGLFGTKRQITRSSRKGLFEVSRYDSSKIKEKLGFEFRSVEKSIEKTGAIFLREKN
ncbi:MAG TPA: NAD-dependent epimerase, partial [Flavobacteriaceae bacterium]|nr:NAD-dependent epimerase [Flavobacteriaceae bacterium]